MRSEFDMLQTHYGADSISARTWDEYASQNQLGDDIQIRLKFNTIYDKAYLDLSRWTIYLEDSEDIGYEPDKIEERAFYPLEALQVSVPGREMEVTDVFGTYISPTYTPGERARYFAEPPMNITYVGNEKLLILYFFRAHGYENAGCFRSDEVHQTHCAVSRNRFWPAAN